jgi:hypothetical protein
MNLTPLGAFAYFPNENMQYPTCRLSQGLDFPGGEFTAMADYAFLATLIYQAPETIQGTLDEWFGRGVGTVETTTTTEFRQNVPGGSAAVRYNLVSFSNGMGVVVVRGSTNAWVSIFPFTFILKYIFSHIGPHLTIHFQEWMTNAQLWSAVALTQVFQFFLPAGEIFNPILDGLLKAMTYVETHELAEIALYSQTSQFVEWLRRDVGFTGPIHITGQSLGGGIALITVSEVICRMRFGVRTQVLTFSLLTDSDYSTRVHKQISPPLRYLVSANDRS